jgi:hypothetical protein
MGKLNACLDRSVEVSLAESRLWPELLVVGLNTTFLCVTLGK